MARRILNLSGSGTLYTVPEGKAAKVFLRYLYCSASGSFSVGGYSVTLTKGSSGVDISLSTSSTNTPKTVSGEGLLYANQTSNGEVYSVLYIPSEYIIGAGAGVVLSSASCTIDIIEEDI